jgi:uncharacterized membrane protein YgaE (UPF0421/DUF939 family)
VKAAMKIFKSYTLTWQQIGIFKLALLAAGAAIGAHWHDFFGANLLALVVITVVAGGYVAFVMLK